MGYRVVQWRSGSAEAVVARAIMDHPDLELVGVLTEGPEQPDAVGDDDTPGVPTVPDLDTLLALVPDCILYSGNPPAGDALAHLVRILTSGANVVAPSTMVPQDPDDRDLFLAWVRAAAAEGASSFLAARDAADDTADPLALVDLIAAVCRAPPGVLAAAEVPPQGARPPDGPGGE